MLGPLSDFDLSFWGGGRRSISEDVDLGGRLQSSTLVITAPARIFNIYFVVFCTYWWFVGNGNILYKGLIPYLPLVNRDRECF